MEFYKVIYDNELCHHGILGMKWGVRRYQNPDGSLTEEGKKRYSKTLERYEHEVYKQKLRNDAKQAYKMSDDELRRKINRLQMEKQLQDLTDHQVNKGRKYVSKVGGQILTGAVTGTLVYLGQAAITGTFDKKKLAAFAFKKP